MLTVGSIVKTLTHTTDTKFDLSSNLIGRNCYNDRIPKGTVCIVQEIIDASTVTIKLLRDKCTHQYFAPFYDISQLEEITL